MIIANQTRVGREAFLAGWATKQKSFKISTIAADYRKRMVIEPPRPTLRN
jgi:hypothetical protein